MLGAMDDASWQNEDEEAGLNSDSPRFQLLSSASLPAWKWYCFAFSEQPLWVPVLSAAAESEGRAR